MKTYPIGLAVVLALGSYGVAQYQAPAPDTSSSRSSTSDQSKSADATAQVDDQALNTKLHEQFNTDATLKNVQIKVSNGVVDLTGSVPSKDDRRRAKEMAQAVPGVRSVREKISVAAASGGPGAAMSAPGHTATSETAHNTAGSIAGNSNTTSASTAGQTGASGEASGTAATAQGAQSGGVTGSTNATGATTDKTGSTSNTGPVGAPTAGAAGQSGTTMQGQTSGIASPADDSSALHSELDSAFQSEPTLSNSHITVNVTDTTIELTGSVPTAKEHVTATRIAQSYAGNRKVNDKITVGGSNPGEGNSSSSGPGSDMGVGNNTRTTGTTPATKDPSMNPPATDNQQTAPPSQNPKTQSDQNSASPR